MHAPLIRARYAINDGTGNLFDDPRPGYPMLVLTFANGREARTDTEQKPRYYGLPAIFLGPEWEDEMPPVLLPANPADNRPDFHFRGCTTDPLIVQLFDDFRTACNNNTFHPHQVYP